MIKNEKLTSSKLRTQSRSIILLVSTFLVVAISLWNIKTSIHLTQFGSKVYNPDTNIESDILVEKNSDFVLNIHKEEGYNETDLEVLKSATNQNYRHEKNVLESILERSRSHLSDCEAISDEKEQVKKKDFDTGVLPLPEFGIINAIQKWLNDTTTRTTTTTSDSSKLMHSSEQSDNKYPDKCYLPPPRLCDAESFSVILMSHSLERLEKLNKGIEGISKWSRVAEIVLVWNSDRAILEKGREVKNKHAIKLLEWNEDKSHPLRIFFSLDHGLTNNLMNRYHPLVQPIQDAMLFFDDDGPFFSELAMDSGFELWKRNSDVQVGSFPRNIRFKSTRMITRQKETSIKGVQHVERGLKNVHPNESSVNNDGSSYPPFTPFCHRQTNEVVEYNYYVFPSHAAHMLLPSGSFLHRNYACFIWHPVFQEIRQYILTHPTHPDDITISTLVSQLSGRPPRTFSRNVKGKKPKTIGNNNEPGEKEQNVNLNTINGQQDQIPQGRRKLLWKQDNWGDMREEAINSIAQYFGNINQGSVGWCAGTEYQKKDKTLQHTCKPQFPDYNMIPWVQKGGLGYDHC